MAIVRQVDAWATRRMKDRIPCHVSGKRACDFLCSHNLRNIRIDWILLVGTRLILVLQDLGMLCKDASV